LLGPPHRRDRLLGEIGASRERLGDRLRSPVGRRIGGRGPEAIALEIALPVLITAWNWRTNS
jgi:xanthine/CO dehydrogenase XdhC/CoxF family maturation factor